MILSPSSIVLYTTVVIVPALAKSISQSSGSPFRKRPMSSSTWLVTTYRLSAVGPAA